MYTFIAGNMDESEEILLVRLLAEGSEQAFSLLYNRYAGKLYNFLLKLSDGNQYLSEEIVQRVFIKVWEMRLSIQPDKTFVSFLYTIAKNMLYNEYEHLLVEFVYKEYCSRQEWTDNSTDRDVELRSLDAFIHNTIERLPPARREIVRLYHEEQLSIKEICKRLHLAESTVHNQLRSATKTIKEELLRHHVEWILLILLI